MQDHETCVSPDTLALSWRRRPRSSGPGHQSSHDAIALRCTACRQVNQLRRSLRCQAIFWVAGQPPKARFHLVWRPLQRRASGTGPVREATGSHRGQLNRPPSRQKPAGETPREAKAVALMLPSPRGLRLQWFVGFSYPQGLCTLSTEATVVASARCDGPHPPN